MLRVHATSGEQLAAIPSEELTESGSLLKGFRVQSLLFKVHRVRVSLRRPKRKT